MKNFPKFHALALVAAALLGYGALAPAQNTNANVKGTKHNMSATGPGNVKSATGASGTDQICVFCHTPHAANATAPGPLWNRTLSSATYTPYTSNSLDAEDILNGPIGQPGGASKLCLSCHDGTIALGAVANSPGSGTGRTISMIGGTSDGKMPTTDSTTGFTRNLGVDLTNDHPISFTFNDALATRDGELRSAPFVAGGKTVVGMRSAGNKPMLPLDHEGKVQCTSCHDPHLDASKFLRLNRFQKNARPGATFNPTNDQICLGCHDKNMQSQGSAYLAWSNSAHANDLVATYQYKAAAATLREFPDGSAKFGSPIIRVWEAGCLNCHDTHTVQGSRRLLREGTDNLSTPKAGGNSAIEETCYQCHTSTTASILENVPTTMTANTGVPDIKREFASDRKRMPIASADQPGSNTERHDIGGNFDDSTFINCNGPDNKCGADFIEQRSTLGADNHTSRHVECTDCHNPHRVIKNSLFNGLGDNLRTHKPAAGTDGADGNVASGALRGTWGVEPVYPAISTSSVWPEQPTSYDVKRGDPGTLTGTGTNQKYLTREYQLCFKCHSDYGAGSNMPPIGYTAGTPATANSYTTKSANWPAGTGNPTGRYTNIAAEFSASARATNPPTSSNDQGEMTNVGKACGGGDCIPTGSSPIRTGESNSANNHRSWHPVMKPTGRDRAERGMNSTGSINLLAPFDTNIGKQTMHCSDCHGATDAWGTVGTGATGADRSKVQGPHGSTSDFLLKGSWDTNVRLPAPPSTSICGKCHQNSNSSGFGGDHVPDDKMGGEACTYCHIAVPHGWKNKAFLVNLLCVGPEGGQSGSCVSAGGYGSESYEVRTFGPYYVSSRLRVPNWAYSGNWASSNCGGGNMEDNCPRTGD